MVRVAPLCSMWNWVWVKTLFAECWFWQRSKQRMPFTPMRASVSTVGPPYGSEAPPPRCIPAEGLIHASRQRLTTSLLALGSALLMWSGVKGKTLCWRLFSKGLRFGLPEELSPLGRWRLRSPEICAWTILAVRGGIYLSPSFKPYTKVWEDSYWDDFWNTTGTLLQCSKLCESSVFLWRSGGAQAPCGGPSVVCQSALAFSTNYSSLKFFF